MKLLRLKNDEQIKIARVKGLRKKIVKALISFRDENNGR